MQPFGRLKRLQGPFSVAVTVVAAYLTLGISLTGVSNILGYELGLDALSRLLLLTALLVSGLFFYTAWHLKEERFSLPAALVMLGFLAAALLVQRNILLDWLFVQAAATTGALLAAYHAERPEQVQAALRYLVAITLACACLFLVFVLADVYQTNREESVARLITAFLTLATGILIAAFPLHFWLPSLAKQTSPLTVGFLTSVNSIVVIGLFLRTQQHFPWLLSDTHNLTVLSAGGTIAALVGALLALSQTDLRRLLAYASISNLGSILVGLATFSKLGLIGAIFTTINHPLSLALLFICAAVLGRIAKKDGAALTDVPGRMVLMYIGLGVGALSLVGVPPFSGFVGKWMIYEAALAYSGYFTVGLLLASVVLFLAFVRYFYQISSRVSSITVIGYRWLFLPILILGLTNLILGLYPAPLISWLTQAIAGLQPIVGGP